MDKFDEKAQAARRYRPEYQDASNEDALRDLMARFGRECAAEAFEEAAEYHRAWVNEIGDRDDPAKYKRIHQRDDEKFSLLAKALRSYAEARNAHAKFCLKEKEEKR